MAFESINNVIDAPPRDTLFAIRTTFSDGNSLSGEIDWQVAGQFAQTQAYNCHLEGDTQGAFDWSELGVEIYQRLKTGESESVHDHEADEMRLRANAIVFCGPNSSDSLLDPEVIEAWFFNLIPFPIEEVRSRSAHVSNVASNDFVPLRSLKERIAVIAELVRQRVFKRSAELSDWTELAEQLP